MEAPMTYGLAAAMLNIGTFTGSTGTTVPREMLPTAEHEQQAAIKRNIVAARARAPRQSISLVSLDINTEHAAGQQIFDAIQALYLSSDLALFDISTEHAAGQQIFDAIQALYLSNNEPRDRQIADRIIALYRDAIAEDEPILTDSLSQFTTFLLMNPALGLPKITLTPDGTLRVRWIHGPGNFVAIEFTGKPLATLVAEIPRDNGLTARHFSSEPVTIIVSIALAIGAMFS